MAIDSKKKKFVASDNPVEQLGGGIVRELVDVPKGILDTALEQIGLKPQKQALSGEINLQSGEHKSTQKPDQKEVSMDAKMRQLQYVKSQEKEVFNAYKKETEQQINRLLQELSAEIKRLESQTAQLTGEIKAITVETMPARPGAYHLNYFEWVIHILKDLRKRVNDSRLWLKMYSNKKQQKGYWGMVKKHGTSYAMSEERALASSIG